jgi:hypothetical protein
MDIIDREILGEPVTVRIGTEDYPLAFPMYAIALYKQETAKLNCRRAREAESAGRPRLTPAEVREMKRRYRKLFDEQDREFFEVADEAVAIRTRLDEEAGIGDSLIQMVNWWKIREDDPERIVLALWAALHREESGTWKSPLSIAQLNLLLDFSNISQIIEGITKALIQYMPKRKEARPNAEALAEARVM